MCNHKQCPWLTREYGFDVPCHYSIENGVKQHEADRGGEVVAVFLQRAGQQVGPLDSHSLLLKQGKVLTAKTKRYRRQQTLREEQRSWSLVERQKITAHAYLNQGPFYFTIICWQLRDEVSRHTFMSLNSHLFNDNTSEQHMCFIKFLQHTTTTFAPNPT